MPRRTRIALVVAVLMLGVYLWPRYLSPRAWHLRAESRRLNTLSASCDAVRPTLLTTYEVVRVKCLTQAIALADTVRHEYEAAAQQAWW